MGKKQPTAYTVAYTVAYTAQRQAAGKTRVLRSSRLRSASPMRLDGLDPKPPPAHPLSSEAATRRIRSLIRWVQIEKKWGCRLVNGLNGWIPVGRKGPVRPGVRFEKTVQKKFKVPSWGAVVALLKLNVFSKTVDGYLKTQVTFDGCGFGS